MWEEEEGEREKKEKKAKAAAAKAESRQAESKEAESRSSNPMQEEEIDERQIAPSDYDPDTGLYKGNKKSLMSKLFSKKQGEEDSNSSDYTDETDSDG